MSTSLINGQGGLQGLPCTRKPGAIFQFPGRGTGLGTELQLGIAAYDAPEPPSSSQPWDMTKADSEGGDGVLHELVPQQMQSRAVQISGLGGGGGVTLQTGPAGSSKPPGLPMGSAADAPKGPPWLSKDFGDFSLPHGSQAHCWW